MTNETACRIDVMLARAQIFLVFFIVLTLVGLTLMLMVYHGEMASVATTIVSSVVAQLTSAMLLGVQYFLGRPRPHTAQDPPTPDPVSTLPDAPTASPSPQELKK